MLAWNLLLIFLFQFCTNRNTHKDWYYTSCICVGFGLRLAWFCFFCNKPWGIDLENLTDFQSKLLKSFYLFQLYNPAESELWYNCLSWPPCFYRQCIKFLEVQHKLIFQRTLMTPPSLVSRWCVCWRNVQCFFNLPSGCDWQYCLIDCPEVSPMIQYLGFILYPQVHCEWILASSSRCLWPCLPWCLKGESVCQCFSSL